MTRLLHWETKGFNDFLLARQAQPFVWGENDCCLFPADAVEAITGEDIAIDFRGRYASKDEAFALIKTVTGGATVADAAAWCAAKAGMTEWAYPLMAQRGDLVVVENGGTLIAGVVHLSGKHVVTMAEHGLVRLPITSVKRAWSY